MEAELKSAPEGAGLTIELIKGDRGVFDVRLDDAMLFSKKIERRFPTAPEILERVKRARN